MAKVYKLTEGDRDIFQKVAQTHNPNWFSSYYLQGENTGTWWNPYAKTDKWRNGYNTLYRVWQQAEQPDSFQYGYEGQESDYRVVWLDDQLPSFHHQHGFIFQPWQLDVYNAPQRIRVIVGGYGCGKTVGGIVGMLVRAATLPGYRGVVLAPNSTMTSSVFNEAMTIMESTLYQKRFLFKSAERPFPSITIANNYVGERNYIKFYPIGDSVGVQKILTLTVDEFFIDQAEQLMNIPEIIRVCGSRMRGQHQGRSRLGRMTFSANAADNEELWDLYDDAEKLPDRVYAASPTTWDNPFITEEQIEHIKQDVGGDIESIAVHMQGKRPITGGEHFSAATLAKCKSETLDERMKAGLEAERAGYILERADKIGVYKWFLPPESGRNYLVAADGGYANPPHRNSPVIVVLDYTDFPHVPAHLVGFHWVFGNNSPEPWLAAFTDAVRTYNAYLSNAFDSTGPQAGYERLVPRLNEIHAYGLSLAGNNKFVYLNHLKRMAARGLFQFPRIQGLFHQLSKYTLPDTNLRQDIVSALMVGAGWLEGVFYTANESLHANEEHRDEGNRYYRDRHVGRGDDRYIRQSASRR